MNMKNVRSTTSRLAHLTLLGLCLSAAACSGGGGGGGDAGSTAPAGAPEDHADSLEALGIDLSASPRVDEYGNPLPDDYNPMGNIFRMDPLSELWLAGVRLKGSDQAAALIQDIASNGPNGNGVVTPEVLHSIDSADAPWLEENAVGGGWLDGGTQRASVGADLNGDGIEEIVSVYPDEDGLRALIVDRVPGGYEEREQMLLFNLGEYQHITLAAGDFDGDAAEDIALGVTLRRY